MDTEGKDSSHLTLDALDLRQPMRVVAVQVPDSQPQWQLWLEEIGFVPGEPVTVLARGVPGGDPLVVRIGASTFALRRAEAACVLVQDCP